MYNGRPVINGYDIAYLAGGLLASPFWLLKGSARRKVKSALANRMGHIPPRPGQAPAVMVHAVSMGEINATRALVKSLQDARPGLHVIVSTTTDTGYERGKQLYGNAPDVTLIHFPLDFTAAVSRTLDNLRPHVVVLMELEVWPNFLRQCGRRNIPVMVVNARLTPHSYIRYKWVAPVARAMFSRLAVVGAQEQAYADQFVSLGVPKDRVTVTGTMKFDTAEVGDTVPGASDLAASLNLRPDEPLWVCGSTGPGEEQIILDAYRDLLKDFPTLRLAIIPRHPERFDEVAKLIEQGGYALVRRSRVAGSQQPVASSNPVILGDTMGELRKFYALATVVLVGRTLVDLGHRQRGSDMIEPAALAKPTIVGPWTHNFAEVMNAFRSANAIYEIPHGSTLHTSVAEILRDPDLSATKARRGQGVVRQGKGATAHHVQMILARPEFGHNH